MNRNVNGKLLAGVLLAVLAIALAGRWAIRQVKSPVSADSLSQGIGERWGGGLPAGYTAETADDLAEGHQFARLTYKDQVKRLLARWTAGDRAAFDAFNALVEAHLALPGLDPAHRSLLESARPEPGENWLAYSVSRDGAQLVLLYDPGNRVLYLAEGRP